MSAQIFIKATDLQIEKGTEDQYVLMPIADVKKLTDTNRRLTSAVTKLQTGQTLLHQITTETRDIVSTLKPSSVKLRRSSSAGNNRSTATAASTTTTQQPTTSNKRSASTAISEPTTQLLTTIKKSRIASSTSKQESAKNYASNTTQHGRKKRLRQLRVLDDEDEIDDVDDVFEGNPTQASASLLAMTSGKRQKGQQFSPPQRRATVKDSKLQGEVPAMTKRQLAELKNVNTGKIANEVAKGQRKRQYSDKRLQEALDNFRLNDKVQRNTISNDDAHQQKPEVSCTVTTNDYNSAEPEFGFKTEKPVTGGAILSWGPVQPTGIALDEQKQLLEMASLLETYGKGKTMAEMCVDPNDPSSTYRNFFSNLVSNIVFDEIGDVKTKGVVYLEGKIDKNTKGRSLEEYTASLPEPLHSAVMYSIKIVCTDEQTEITRLELVRQAVEDLHRSLQGYDDEPDE